MRNDVVRMYRDIHSWVGIICGLALFIAFYAGAISMFEEQLQRWASAPVDTELVTSLSDTPKLIDKVLDEHPSAVNSFRVFLEISPEQPARLNWESRVPGEDDHAPAITYFANLNAENELEVTTKGPSGVAQLVDTLHQQVGLPFEHEVSEPIMGIVALLYGLALVSGIFVLIPTLVKDLFALRIGKNVKRMWLDLHNLLGIFSLPFHIIMSLTAVVFAFHTQFYNTQKVLIHSEEKPPAMQADKPKVEKIDPTTLLAPEKIIERLKEQAPEYQPKFIEYYTGRDGKFGIRVGGTNPAYGTTWAREGNVEVEPRTGAILRSNYMPGRQGIWNATVTTFFSLHFGNFGGVFVQWCYFFLGLIGSFIFYTGNLLWIETRRKRNRNAKEGAIAQQTKSSRVLAALTVGISLGCISGISLTLASAKLLPQLTENLAAWHYNIYYSVFLVAIAWAFLRGAAKAAVELLVFSALMTLMIPASSLLSVTLIEEGWNHLDNAMFVDFIALIGAIVLFFISKKTKQRVKQVPNDSVWYASTVKK